MWGAFQREQGRGPRRYAQWQSQALEEGPVGPTDTGGAGGTVSVGRGDPQGTWGLRGLCRAGRPWIALQTQVEGKLCGPPVFTQIKCDDFDTGLKTMKWS